MESDDSLHTTILIETMAYDQEQGEKEEATEESIDHSVARKAFLKIGSQFS